MNLDQGEFNAVQSNRYIFFCTAVVMADMADAYETTIYTPGVCDTCRSWIPHSFLCPPSMQVLRSTTNRSWQGSLIPNWIPPLNVVNCTQSTATYNAHMIIKIIKLELLLVWIVADIGCPSEQTQTGKLVQREDKLNKSTRNLQTFTQMDRILQRAIIIIY